MTEPTLDTLTPRLERLEREVRWWRIASGVAAAIFLFVGASPQSPVAGKLVAREFILVDQAGRSRARLGFLSDGPPGLSFVDEQGRVLAHFDVHGLVLQDEQQKTRVGLIRKRDGNPVLAFNDAGAQPRVRLDIDEIDAGLTLFDNKHNVRAVVGAFSVPTAVTAESSLVLQGTDGKVIWRAP